MKKPSERLPGVGSCCRKVRPTKYTVRVTGGSGRDQRFCCAYGYLELRDTIKDKQTRK